MLSRDQIQRAIGRMIDERMEPITKASYDAHRAARLWAEPDYALWEDACPSEKLAWKMAVVEAMDLTVNLVFDSMETVREGRHG